MPISLSGTLHDPYGSPRSDATITFRAIATSGQVLEHANAAAITGADGEYAITVEFGRYNIEVKESGSPSPRIIAKNVLINGDTTAADLNELVVAANGYDDLTPQIVVEFRALRDETQGYRDEAVASAQSASADAAATAADRQAVANDRAHVDQQRQAVDVTADEVEADRLAAQTARTGAEDAQGASETARDESRAWATGDGVIDNISGTDRFSARLEADRAADERQGAEDAATASSDSATLAGQRATTAGEHEAAAGDSATESSNWATYPIDTPVPEGDGSQYSSRHWAEIARQRAVNAMVAQGAWDASTGALPAEPAGASYWLVTGAPNGVTVEGVEYRNKDMLLWTPGATSSDPGQWSKIDNTDSVVSVAGKAGAVELVPSDVGADPAGTAAAKVAEHEAKSNAHTPAQVGADPAGTAAQTMNNHVAAPDPHAQYAKSADLGSAAEANTGTGASDVPTTSQADGRYIRIGQYNNSPGTVFGSGAPPFIANIGSSGNNYTTAVRIDNRGNDAAAAVITFLRLGLYGVHFGIDVDNKLKIGGWSMGDVAHEILHEGNYRDLLAEIGETDVSAPHFLRNETGATISGGQVVSGSSLARSSTADNDGVTMPGSWQCLGSCPAGAATLFRRVS